MPVTTSIPSRMVPSPAAFTALPREPGRRESEPRESGLRLLEPDPRPPRSPRRSGPQSSSSAFLQEQQPQQRAQKDRPPRREHLSGSGSGSGEGVVGGCQGFPPQRPTSERGPPDEGVGDDISESRGGGGTGRDRWDGTDSAARMESVGRAGKWFLRGEGGAKLLGRRGRLLRHPHLGEEVQRLGAGK